MRFFVGAAEGQTGKQSAKATPAIERALRTQSAKAESGQQPGASLKKSKPVAYARAARPPLGPPWRCMREIAKSAQRRRAKHWDSLGSLGSRSLGLDTLLPLTVTRLCDGNG
jgi:hypothetical protein